MTTPFARLAWRLGLAAALVLAAAGTSSADSNEASAAVTHGLTAPQRIALEPSTSHPVDPGPTGRPGPYSYRWPVKPFGKQHPVRGFFGDPRIANHGESRQFHFGIDISAPDGTPVYATLTGRLYIHPLHPTTIMVVDGSGLEFSYWHVVPAVRDGTRAVAYKTVIGHIEAPYAHVHFSERRGGRYLNPLRSGALGPYIDDTTPTVRSVTLASDELVAEPYDETPLAVPRPWHDLPVMPALVRWRILDSHGRAVVGWTTAVDFRLTIPSASAFDDIWASGTTQNHVRAPGHYRLRLGALADLPSRSRVVEVAVRDTRGNASVRRFPLDLSHS
jgi:hypothetical protein